MGTLRDAIATAIGDHDGETTDEALAAIHTHLGDGRALWNGAEWRVAGDRDPTGRYQWRLVPVDSEDGST